MAEGMARLNQHVVGADYWDRSDRLSPREWTAAPDRPDPAQSNRPLGLDDVRDMVASDVIPRLCPGLDSAHATRPAGSDGVTEADIETFADLLVSSAHDQAVDDILAGLRSRGLSVEQIYLGLFQPAARRIGELWVADLCSFVDVTLAVGTMQRSMRILGEDFHRNGRAAHETRAALLASLPGDQHTFGLAMVGEFFRRSGWTVSTTSVASIDDLVASVASRWFAVVGLSISRDDLLGDVPRVVDRLREASINRGLGIMVGGPAVVNCPELAARTGADAVSRNAAEALLQAEPFGR